MQMTKEKATYAIQSFMTFLNIAKMTQDKGSTQIESCRDKALDLMEHLLSNQLDTLSALLQLNQLIENVNQLLKAPYPVVMTDSSENFVKGEIVAFEHYLNQELRADHLSVQDEVPLFNDSLILWGKIGVTMSAKEGTLEFTTLIKKVNRLLPQNEQYPLPDSDQY